MIVEGLGLMVAGMGVVFAFLTLLVFAMMISAKVLKRFTDADVTGRPLGKPRAATFQQAGDDLAEIAVAIAAVKACARS
ncbi:OadG family transporter subunit [Desulfoluna sp.]|uniref:OadG family protein n=1 Tax=Desulfoluna sp. TaxID=2045199 RepID=UPI00260E8546|nr:OadG family transporter subunit [Desulfoluna sp.]